MNQSARKFFWFKKHNNYGDILTPFICQELNIECEFAPLAAAQNLMVGSIAAIAQRGMKIYGSGFIRFNDKVVHGAKYTVRIVPVNVRIRLMPKILVRIA